MLIQGERRSVDGPVTVERHDQHERVLIGCVTHGKIENIYCTPYNAWRILAGLAQILGAELPRKLLKTIRMG